VSSTSGGGPVERSAGIRDWLTLQRVVLGLVAVATLISIPFGGLRDAKDDDPDHGVPRIEVNQLSEGGPFNVTVTGGRLLKDQDGLHTSKDNNRWLCILATLEVTDTKSSMDFYELFVVKGAQGIVSKVPDVRVVSDLAIAPALHPGVPEKMVFLWEQEADAPVPTQVEVTIIGKTYRPDSFTNNLGWFDATERAVLTVPIVDRRNA
jgi:hypothetical protein